MERIVRVEEEEDRGKGVPEGKVRMKGEEKGRKGVPASKVRLKGGEGLLDGGLVLAWGERKDGSG